MPTMLPRWQSGRQKPEPKNNADKVKLMRLKKGRGQIAQAVADADHARCSDGLRCEAKLAARLAASERARGAATASEGAAGTTGSELLAELFRRADQRAGELAAIADQARIRGLTCEAAYDALTGQRWRNSDVKTRSTA
jgi:hypothetical protein